MDSGTKNSKFIFYLLSFPGVFGRYNGDTARGYPRGFRSATDTLPLPLVPAKESKQEIILEEEGSGI